MQATPPTAARHPPNLDAIELLDSLRKHARRLGRSLQTERTYVYWLRHFLCFHRHAELGWRAESEIEAFMQWIACRRRVAASTRQQARSALRFFYREVLGVAVGKVSRQMHGDTASRVTKPPSSLALLPPGGRRERFDKVQCIRTRGAFVAGGQPNRLFA